MRDAGLNFQAKCRPMRMVENSVLEFSWGCQLNSYASRYPDGDESNAKPYPPAIFILLQLVRIEVRRKVI